MLIIPDKWLKHLLLMETIMHMVLKSIKIMIMALVMEVIQVKAATVAIQARAAIAQATVLAIMIIM